jgi:hypothetical protein
MTSPRDTYRALLEGRLEPEARERLPRELADDASELSQFVDSLPEDEVERDLRDAWTAPAPLSSAESNALWSRLEGQLKPPSRASERWPAIAGALAALLCLVLIRPDSWTGEKGPARVGTPHLQLVFHVGQHEPNRPVVIRRGLPGERYRVDSDILLRYQTGAPGYVCLVHQLPSGATEALTPAAPTAAGWHDLRVGGKIQGVKLSPQPGRNVFFAVWSAQPIACPQIIDEIRTQARSDVLVDSFEVTGW